MTPRIKVADPFYNAKEIAKGIEEAWRRGAKLIVFPELCLTGYTCGDLFLQEILLTQTMEALAEVRAATEDSDALVFVGMPLVRQHKLYNVAAVLQDGEILAFIPKRYIPSYAEFYETRHFVAGNLAPESFLYEEKEIPFGTDILFQVDAVRGLTVGCEICEDIWAPESPATAQAPGRLRAMFTRLPGKGSPRRISFSAVTILLRRTVRCWHRRSDLKQVLFMQTWIFTGFLMSGAG